MYLPSHVVITELFLVKLGIHPTYPPVVKKNMLYVQNEILSNKEEWTGNVAQWCNVCIIYTKLSLQYSQSMLRIKRCHIQKKQIVLVSQTHRNATFFPLL